MNFRSKSHVLEAFFWILLIALWFVPLGCRALIHTDEGRYATLALNMIADQDWITPRLNGILYFEKPILQYWMSAILFLLFGVSDFTARLWPALTGFFTLLVVSYTAGRLWGRKARQMAAMIAGGMFWIIANSHFLTVDMSLTFFLTLTLCSFILSQFTSQERAALTLLATHKQTTKEQRLWMLLVWASMGCAVLTKGLVGLLIPGATLVLYSLINQQFRFWKNLQWIWGLLLFSLITVPWFLCVSERNEGFAHFFFIHEHWERFLTTEHNRTGAIWYFAPILVLGALPWTSWLPRLFMNGIYDRGETGAKGELRIQRLLLIWILFIFLFFSKSNSKLPSYILPMFPAMALMLTWHLSRIQAEQIQKHLLLPGLLGLGLLIASPVMGMLMRLEDYPALFNLLTTRFGYEAKASDPYLQPLYFSLIFCGALLLIGTWIAHIYLKQSKKRIALLSLTITMLLFFNIASIGYDSYGSRFKSTRDIIPQIANDLTPETEIFSVAYYDQTFPFYLRRNITLVNYADEFNFGETQEPTVWIPTIKAFMERWNQIQKGVAIMDNSMYLQLKTAEFPMEIIYQDERRTLVRKPSALEN